MWTGYLLLATAAALGPITSTHFLTPDIYRPAATLLLVAACLGVVVFWPMVRLSQEIPGRSIAGSVLLDILAILVPLQATIWPQAIPALAHWDVQVAAAISAHSVAWMMATGGVLAIALLHVRHCERAFGWNQLLRSGWMAFFVALACAGWGVSVLMTLNQTPQAVVRPALWSPATAVFDMTADRSWYGRAAVIGPEHWKASGLVAAVAACVWIAAAALEYALSGTGPGTDKATRRRDDVPR